MKVVSALIVLAVAFVGTLPLSAQSKKPISPHETITAQIDGAKLTLSYGRPYTKDPKSGEIRKVWGSLVPYGAVWRTGANEATVLITDKPLVFGSTTIPAGSYSLWTVPEADGTGKLIFNSETGQWGTKHNAAKDFANAPLKSAPLSETVDQFTMTIEPGATGGGSIHLRWEKNEYVAWFTVGK